MSFNAEEYIARLGILFVIFAVISSGYVINAGISCQMQRFLQSKGGMHTVGVLMVLIFLLMEGGMSFDPKVDDEAPTNWTRANVISTIAISLIVYGLFILSSKMQFWPNLIFYVMVMVMYLLMTHRRFLKDRKRISPKTDARIQKFIDGLLIGISVVGAYGIVDYVPPQKVERGPNFSWWKFFIGNTCRRLGSQASPGPMWI